MTKTCCNCRRSKPISEFARCASSPDGLQRRCRQCRRERYLQQRERTLEYSKAHYQRNRSKRLEQARQYRAENRHRVWAYHTLNKHRSQGYRIEIDTDRLTVLAQTCSQCGYCGCTLKWDKGVSGNNSPTLDRVDNGDTLTPESVQIICARCNASKADRTHDEFVTYCRQIANLGD